MQIRRRFITRRYTDIGAGGTNVVLPNSYQYLLVHYESGDELFRIGPPDGTADEAARITQSGVSTVVSFATKAGVPSLKLYAPHILTANLSGPASQNGNRVEIPCTQAYQANQTVSIWGTPNYDGIYVLPAQSNPGTTVTITSAWKGATIDPGAKIAALPQGAVNVSVIAI